MRAATFAFLAALALAPLAHAQAQGSSTRGRGAPADAKPTPPAPASATPPAPAPRASAFVQIASEISRALGQVPPGALVVVSPLASDIPAPKGEELANRLATQIAGRTGGAAHGQAAPLAVARGLAGRAASLIYVQLEIVKGELRATADLYPVVSNGWERLRNPVPGPHAHAFASAPIDAEIRTFLTPVLLEQLSVHKAKHEEGEVLAIGCGDVDGDGGMELVLVTRARVSIGRLRAGKFVPQRTAPWTSLASRASVPMREPLATVLVAPAAHRSEILVGITDRGGIATDPLLVTKRQLTGLPVVGLEGDGCAVPSAEASAFEGSPVPCLAPAKGDPPSVLAAPAPRWDAGGTLNLVGKDGSASQVIAAREPGGRLRVRRLEPGAGKPFEIVIENTGAQVALVNIDLDGTAEVVTTTESDNDMIVISSFTKTQLVARLRLPAKDGVRALGVCPPEERGVPALVAAVGSEVWLVR